MKYWSTPKEKIWFVVSVDGKSVGIFQEGADAEREKKRLSGLKGIKVCFARPSDLIQFNAKTVLSSRILRVMSEKSACYGWKLKFKNEFVNT